DFGISKDLRDQSAPELAATGDLQALGSPLYMSYEQMKSSKNVDQRTDLWSLGVILYELVAGKTPFHEATVQQLVTRVYFGAPTPLSESRGDAPAGFESVILQCLQRDLVRRFQTVADLAAALTPFAPDAAVHTQRAAALLGVHAKPERRTDLLPG